MNENRKRNFRNEIIKTKYNKQIRRNRNNKRDRQKEKSETEHINFTKINKYFLSDITIESFFSTKSNKKRKCEVNENQNSLIRTNDQNKFNFLRINVFSIVRRIKRKRGINVTRKLSL